MDHTPADAPTPMKIWAAQIGLGELLEGLEKDEVNMGKSNKGWGEYALYWHDLPFSH